MKKIAVIGGGWYGSHIALELALKGYKVNLYEKNSHLFSEISGLFGIRLHVGPHYPRSEMTRKSCLYGFLEFTTKYPELIIPHEFSVYAIGNKDASGMPSKVTVEEFVKVCQENSKCRILYDAKRKGYDNLQVVVDLAEPSVYVGRGLHDFFREKLLSSKVTVVFNYNVRSVKRIKTGEIEIENDKKKTERFNYVVNTTSFQSLLPVNRLRLPFEVFYQPCLALVYEDTQPTSEKSFSFIVMDGWFPCLMPSVEYGVKPGTKPKRYILTHGMWTIMASYAEVDEARKHLESIDNAFVAQQVRPNCEAEINRFWPSFRKRFRYIEWIGAVLAKIKNNREFRGSVTFQDTESGMIYVLPGKVSNIFDAREEVEALIENNNVIHNKEAGFSYIKNGTLDTVLPVFSEAITERNTCDLQTFRIKASKEEIVRSLNDKKEVAVSVKQQSPWTAAFLIKKLLLVMVASFVINEFREHPNQSARSFLGFVLFAASIIAVMRVSNFVCLNQSLTLWRRRRGKKDSAHCHLPKVNASKFS